MIYLFALIPIAILAFLLWRAERRYDLAIERWSEERTNLLQRIQAPERAVVEDFEPSDLHQYASFGVDEEAIEAVQEAMSGRR